MSYRDTDSSPVWDDSLKGLESAVGGESRGACLNSELQVEALATSSDPRLGARVALSAPALGLAQVAQAVAALCLQPPASLLWSATRSVES